MPALHLINVGDFVSIHATVSAGGSITTSFTLNYDKLKPILNTVSYTDTIGWVLPVGRYLESINGIACWQYRLLASDAPTKKMAVAEVDRLFLVDQIQTLFRSFAPSQYIFELIESSEDMMAHRLSRRAGGINYDLVPIEDESELDDIDVTRVDSHGSTDRVFEEVLMCLPEYSERRMHRCAEAGKPRLVDNTMYERDIAAGVVERVFCSVDNTLLYSDWVLYAEVGLRRQCDALHAFLLKAGVVLVSEYPKTGSSAERYAVLKLSALEAFLADHESIAAINALQKLYYLNTPDLYRARLDQWFNVLHARYHEMNADKAKALSNLYRDAPLVNREMEFVQMLTRARRKRSTQVFAEEMLASLKQTMQHLSVHRPMSKAVLGCLRDADRVGVKHELSSRRVRPEAGLDPYLGPLSLGSMVLYHSDSAFHKGDASYVARLADSTHYIGSVIDPNGHRSSMMLFHTIAILLSGEVFNQAKTRYLYMLDHDMRETHPLLVLQCNALFRREHMNLKWKTVSISQGGEPLNAALAHPDHAVSEDVENILCEHCMPERVFELTHQYYQRLMSGRAAVASGVGGGLNLDVLRDAYQQVWGELASVAVVAEAVVEPNADGEAVVVAPGVDEVMPTTVTRDLHVHGVFSGRSGAEAALASLTVADAKRGEAIASVAVEPLGLVDGHIDWPQYSEPDGATPLNGQVLADEATFALATSRLPLLVEGANHDHDDDGDTKVAMHQVSQVRKATGY